MDSLPAYLSGFVALLLLTSFVKIFTSLHILRAGIGLHGGSYGVVILGLSLALSLLVMSPQLRASGGLEGLLGGEQKAASKLDERFRPFLEKHANPEVVTKLSALHARLDPQPAAAKDAAAKPSAQTTQTTEFSVLVPSFLVSQLQEAFQLGVIFLIPFVVIDLLVMNVLVALGIANLSAAVVAFPLKLLLFFAVDGWSLVAEKLIGGYLP